MVLVRKICAKIHLNWEIGKEIVKKLYFCTKICMQMKENVLKAALFDLDGVVFDTEPQYSVFWGSQCRLYHPEHPGLENEIKGMTLTEIYDRLILQTGV